MARKNMQEGSISGWFCVSSQVLALTRDDGGGVSARAVGLCLPFTS